MKEKKRQKEQAFLARGGNATVPCEVPQQQQAISRDANAWSSESPSSTPNDSPKLIAPPPAVQLH
ncbi:unnamed protein product [Gongylonema pulchrum]|uniref:Uncharacterized protein n=1 Tax=Gongylonema pulchrum TaxID=637853 RepID=A0A183DBT2_9BILA|nr:unnamed protein product [Gongylonema pulchrum]VDK53899.1 unnamed protein product [Gongylonema pulchrum]